MFDTREYSLLCPYCGETITLLIDGSIPRQQYVEDCSVCCCPIVVDVQVDEADNLIVQGWPENS